MSLKRLICFIVAVSSLTNIFAGSYCKANILSNGAFITGKIINSDAESNVEFSTPKTTVMILSFRTPKTFVVITLKFELCGFTID